MSNFAPIKLGSKQFRGSSKKLLEFDTNVEFDAHSFSDVVFVSIYDNFQRSPENSATMQVDVITLRQIIVGIKGVLISGTTDLRLKTGGAGKVKILTIAPNEGESPASTFFINIKKDGVTYGAPFTRTQLQAMSTTLERYCDNIDEKMMDLYYTKSIKQIKASASKK